MRYFVIGLLLWFTALLPGSAESAEKNEHRIITFKASLREAMQKDPDWKMCGNYFAKTEIAKDKILHFAFEKGPPGNLTTVFTFTMLERVIVSIKEKVATPRVTVKGEGLLTEFFLVMNVKDYKTALPCLTRGMKV
jgi:hypothetical protein